jgi:hypothetical protein
MRSQIIERRRAVISTQRLEEYVDAITGKRRQPDQA